jgi:nucleotide-binding universal stress UspA family protein
MYKRILIPLENSWADEAILSHIRGLARVGPARIWLVHVADGHAARNQEQLNLEDSQEIREDRAYLERRRGELAADGFVTEFELARGEPTAAIVAMAQRINADLIAMATHGHGVVKDLVLGSVASDVRHRTDIPVLLVRARKP